MLTIPTGVKDRDFPTLQSKKGGYDPSQLWRFVPSAYGVNVVIQNYSLDGNGMVLYCTGGAGKELGMWSRGDSGSERFYVNI